MCEKMTDAQKAGGRVTGVITTYKRRPEIVERAIQSMLAQTYPLCEVIVVDDNEDGSDWAAGIKELCGRYDEVRYVKQDGNRGACAARNLGTACAEGEYIGFLDDDDEWLPEKTEKQMEAFVSSDVPLGLVFCSGIQINERTGIRSPYYTGSEPVAPSYVDLLGNDLIGTTSNPLIRKAALESVGGFWEEQPSRQDYELWIRIAREYPVMGIGGEYFLYRLHGGTQITKDKKKSYIGCRNIYTRYKDDYKKYPRARINILNRIIRSRTGITTELLRFAVERQYLQMRYGLPRNESKKAKKRRKGR